MTMRPEKRLSGLGVMRIPGREAHDRAAARAGCREACNLGRLTRLSRGEDMPADPLRYAREHEHLHGAFGADRFGAIAERVARFFGTPQYIVSQSVLVAVWVAVNAIAFSLRWDPYPFILLNLAFSTQA